MHTSCHAAAARVVCQVSGVAKQLVTATAGLHNEHCWSCCCVSERRASGIHCWLSLSRLLRLCTLTHASAALRARPKQLAVAVCTQAPISSHLPSGLLPVGTPRGVWGTVHHSTGANPRPASLLLRLFFWRFLRLCRRPQPPVPSGGCATDRLSLTPLVLSCAWHLVVCGPLAWHDNSWCGTFGHTCPS